MLHLDDPFQVAWTQKAENLAQTILGQYSADVRVHLLVNLIRCYTSTMVNHLKLLSIKLLLRNIRGQRTTSQTRSHPIWRSPISRPSFDLTATELAAGHDRWRFIELSYCCIASLIHLYYPEARWPKSPIVVLLKPLWLRLQPTLVTTCIRISNFKGGNHCFSIVQTVRFRLTWMSIFTILLCYC